MEEKVYERQVMKQATAKRVIDEHQIGRHYNSNDLMELYQYDLSAPEVREVPILPKDRLFADLIKKHEKVRTKLFPSLYEIKNIFLRSLSPIDYPQIPRARFVTRK